MNLIDSEDKIHSNTSNRRLAKEIIKQLNEYHDKNTFLGWSKRKKKFVLKKFK